MKYGDIDLLAVAGDKVVWSRALEGGVYEAPLSGGAPRLLPGTERFHLLQWPWAARVDRRADEPSDPSPSFRHVVNLLTGAERRTDDATMCSLTWCLGGRPQYARRRDGSGGHRLPGHGLFGGPPALDRFLVRWPRAGVGTEGRLYLHDLATGRTGDLGVRFENGSKTGSDLMGATRLDHTTPYVLTYPLKNRQMVVNLTAIR